MNLTKRREVLKKFYTPLGVALYRLHFPPNFITLLSVITGMLSAYFFWHGKLLTAVGFFASLWAFGPYGWCGGKALRKGFKVWRGF